MTKIIIMKKILFVLIVTFSAIGNAQSIVQTVNSGSVISASSSVSIGEIVVVPENTSQSNTGIIGILVQINSQTLEVEQFEVAENISVFPNPTVAKLFFSSKNSLMNKKVLIYNELGQLLEEKKVDTDNALNLENLASGIFIIQFEDRNLKTFKIIKK